MPERPVYIVLACLLILITPLKGYGKSLQGLVKQGNSAYKGGEYDNAVTAYDEALKESPESPYIYFNKGAALYKKGDYTGACEAFEKAVQGSKDPLFEAKARFNLGNSSYKEAEGLMDDDLQEALECCSNSIDHYQEALELDPSLTEAAENIEMVRLVMKNILDEIQKQEEATKEEQEKTEQAKEELKDIIKEQEEALEKTRELEKEQSGTGDLEEKTRELADEQKALKDRTEELSEERADTPASQHLENATKEQEAAYGNLNEGNIEEAAGNQEGAIEELKEALDSMEKDGNNGAGQKDEGQEDEEQGQQQQQASSADENLQDQDEEAQEQAAMANLSDDAQDILNEEKENKEQRRALTIRGYKEVEKDW